MALVHDPRSEGITSLVFLLTILLSFYSLPCGINFTFLLTYSQTFRQV